MNLLHLKYFYEVARTGTFVEGARNLRVSQPAISKMVKQLEGELGTLLFVRSRQGVKLTEAGEELFQSAGKIFLEAESAAEKLRAARTELTGEWTLGISDNLGLYLAPDLIARFKETHPRLRVGLFAGTSSQIKTELHYDRAQLGIFFTPVKSSEPFEHKLIYETEFWIVLARKNKWFKKESITLEDLQRAEVPRVESRHRDYSGGFPAHFHSKGLGMQDKPWLEVNQHEVKKRLVLGGHCYALLTRHTVEEEVKSGKLVRVQSKRLPSPVYAVWKKGQVLGRASTEFLAEWERALGKRAN